MPEKMLELVDFHYHYGQIHAIKGISLYVDQGEIVSLIGGNGAGKTTTLRAISGLLSPKGSGGEQQMLAVGRALMQRPKLLMMDEPSLGLAPRIINDIFKTIQKINQDGLTILLVEQNSNAALQIAHRGYVMETGNLMIAGTAEELRSNPEIHKSYLGSE